MLGRTVLPEKRQQVDFRLNDGEKVALLLNRSPLRLEMRFLEQRRHRLAIVEDGFRSEILQYWMQLGYVSIHRSVVLKSWVYETVIDPFDI